jgi:sulfotransferase
VHNGDTMQREEGGLDNGIHFISGLPRAGSTLLAALLRQNPRLHAGMTSPVGSLLTAVMREMSQGNETAVFFDDDRRAAILRALFDGYYGKEHPAKLVFDTNRLWCSKLPLLTALFPQARVICTVRHVPWILDSLERLVRRNRFELSKIFNFEPGGTVYSRIEGLGAGTGLVGFAWNALREAYFGEDADRLLLVSYETLTSNPRAALDAIYQFIGEPPFAHDPDNVVFDDAVEFDARLGTPGLHAVGRVVHAVARPTVLPPDLFRRYEPDSFWRDASLNLRGVPVV